MGMPFPLGLASVAAGSRQLVPWAWGINACASVVAAILATIMAIHVGFSVVVLLAVVLYALAATAFRAARARKQAPRAKHGDATRRVGA